MIFIKKPNLTKKFWRLEGEGVGVARVSDFFLFFFSNESKSKKIRFLFEGVKVREDWLV